ncbi:MAG: protease SohB [Gammaproteobacteria bacterium]|nr:protease SohB [Gammaproteobacteria bacterium]NIR84143.1 protease SohB [Gammaproteobacteria bacterium]NIR89455.1 protease SohB [Gammaproteobacteria bacterium]NIU05298.1 protease SohB [Gammaproteobacteria bacterium]NIV52238.1 protease SohB [Gammaproteobacteria bacterium]
MADILMQYGLFLAKVMTVVIAIGIVVAMLVTLSRRERAAERLEVKNLNKKYEQMSSILKKEVLPKKAFKESLKTEKKRKKAAEKSAKGKDRRKVYVVNFRGDIKATAVASLREEITAILSLAKPEDEVLLRLENAGGLVHEHGLAASQLLRIKQRKIPLTVAVDKVAASGGYMMACVADRIIAAPFAIVGSIGVLAQLPNFHRWLDSHGVDFEQFKAGEFKRTVTVFGKNTEEDRAKFKQDIEDVHALFKEFVAENRPDIDIGRVSTGEHWYGKRALDLKLIDQLTTSDDYLLAASREANLYEVRYVTRRTLAQTLASALQRGGVAPTWRTGEVYESP